MKKKILTTACLFALVSSPAFGESSSPARNDQNETRPYADKLPYHMMLYQQAEEEAQNQYSTIVETPEDQNSNQEQDQGKEEKIKGDKE